MTKASHRRLPRLLLLLYAANSFLFLLLSFFFLPDPVVKVLGSAFGVALGLLGLKSLNPSEADSMSPLARHRSLVIATLSVAAMLQGVLLGLGFANPFRVEAVPGSTVFVDGKFFARIPDPTEESRDLRLWLQPQPIRSLLRWGRYEVRVSKKWYVDDDGSQESVRDVWVKVWPLNDAFAHWTVAKLGQRPLLKIDYGIKELQDQRVGNLPLAVEIQKAVADWDLIWVEELGVEVNAIGPTRSEPYVAALQVVQGDPVAHVELQIRDWMDHPLQRLRPIAYIESNSDTPLNLIRDNVFSQLLHELAIPKRFKLSQVAVLTQALQTSVAALPITPEFPLASPAPTVTATSTPTLIPSLTPTPDPIKVVDQLQTAVTQALNNNQFDVALAVEHQLKATLNKVQSQSAPKQTQAFVQRLEEANAEVAAAIKSKGPKGRIYIHIANESQREPARKLQSKLVGDNQFIVIGIQNVGGRAYIPDTAEVRFFAKPPTTEQSANTIVEILKRPPNGISKVRASYVIPSERDKMESSDITTHFEIWLARDSFAEAD